MLNKESSISCREKGEIWKHLNKGCDSQEESQSGNPEKYGRRPRRNPE
jgi:hypothetical protein